MEPVDILILADRDVPRLRYAAGILLGEIMGLRWELVTGKTDQGNVPVINYSSGNIEGSFRISPADLLFSQGTVPQEITVSDWNGLPVFFSSGGSSDLPFDIFAATFYLASRYEEYLSFIPDCHGRFCGRSSLAFRNGFLRKPVIDLWAGEWMKLLSDRFPGLTFKKASYRQLVTFDIDQPFKYLGKDALRNIAGFFRDFGTKGQKAVDRYRTLTGRNKDPWDVFGYMTEETMRSGAEPRFFIPAGDRSRFDRHPSWKNKSYRDLILRVAERADTGLHPSFNAASGNVKLKTEAERLRSLVGREITSSRFHYLNLKFPLSYRVLIEAGIKEDYTLGFHDEPGFRAGIARPFYFYDIVWEKQTDLRIFPFQVMDATLYGYLNMSPGEAGKVIEELIDVTKQVCGLFVSVWHNTTLRDTEEWKEWRRLFELMLKIQQ